MSNSRTALYLVLLVAFVLRIAAIFAASPAPFASDPDDYRALAENLVQHGAFGTGDTPTAYRPPLYPLLLVPGIAFGGNFAFGVGLLHVVCGLVTVAGAIWLAEQWTQSRWSWLAGLLVACDPILLRQISLVMTETVAAALATVSLVLLTHASRRGTFKLALAAGVSLGLATLCRPTFLPWAVLCSIVFWFCSKSESPKRSFARASAVFIAMLLTIAPWVVRNQISLGQPIVTTTHGGYTLLLGNNERYFDFLAEHGLSQIWTSSELDEDVVVQRFKRAQPLGARDEVADDRAESAAGWNAIRSNLTGFAASALIRIASLSGVLSQQLWAEGGSHRALAVIIGLWFLLQAVLAARGAWRLWRSENRGKEWLFAVLLIAIFAGVHCFYWANNRMRAPLAPAIAVLAIAGLPQRGKPPQAEAAQSLAV